MAIKFLNNVAVDSDVLYVDTVNNRVGIGTTNPGAKLDIVTSDSGSQIELTSPTPGIKLIDSNLTTRYAEIKAENGNINIDIDPGQAEGASYFSVDIDNSEKFRITKDGNVGIGTTSPSTKLHILQSGTAVSSDGVSSLVVQKSAAAGTAAAINIVSGDSAEASLRFGDTTDQSMGALRYLNDVDAFSIVTNNNDQVRIDSSGNVGIGTTSPSGLLDVSNGTNSIFIENGGAYPELNADVVLRIGQRTEIWGGGTGRHYLDVRDPNGNQNIKLNGEGNSFFSNNLGIGTASPSEKLQVNGNIKFGGITDKLLSSNGYARLAFDVNGGFILGDENYDVSGTFIKSDGINYRIDFESDATTLMRVGLTAVDIPSYIRHLGDTNTRFGFATNDTFLLQTAGSTRLYVGSNGNVGVGKTTGIGAKLDVAGGVRIADDTAAASASNVGTLRYRTSGNNSYVDMCMQTGATTYAWVNIVQNNW